MSIKKNIEAKLAETNANIAELKECFDKEDLKNKDGMMKSIFRNSIQKQNELREILEGLLKTELRYNFITYLPSVGENLSSTLMTEAEVIEELQRMVDDEESNGTMMIIGLVQFMVDWQHDKTKNAIKFSNDDELYIQEVPE